MQWIFGMTVAVGNNVLYVRRVFLASYEVMRRSLCKRILMIASSSLRLLFSGRVLLLCANDAVESKYGMYFKKSTLYCSGLKVERTRRSVFLLGFCLMI